MLHGGDRRQRQMCIGDVLHPVPPKLRNGDEGGLRPSRAGQGPGEGRFDPRPQGPGLGAMGGDVSGAVG